MARILQPHLPPRRPARGSSPRGAADGATTVASVAPSRRTSVKRGLQRGAAPVRIGAWQFVCLVQIGNFAALRRHLGPTRAEDLARELEARIAVALPEASSLAIGRATIEVAFIGDGFGALEAAVAKLREATARPFDIDTELHAFEILVGAAGAPRGTTEDVRLVEEAEGALDDTHADQDTVLRDLSAGTAAFDRLTLTRELPRAIANLQILADQGIVIAIDDYGAGLSSLAYLKQLPARELKIDKMFVLQLTSSNRDPLIVRSTIDLAHALDMEVTAEGVETQAAMALLSVMGCDMIQGYLISRPVSIDAFRRFLHDYRERPAEDPRKSMFQRSAAFWKSA